jgi:hypothetical protein
METIAIFIALLLCAGAVGLFVGMGRWIVLPIDRAAKSRGGPVQFSIGDFLCLFFAIQLPLSAIHVLVESRERLVFWLFTIAAWIVGPMVWLFCGRALSKAGIRNGTRRYLFLGLVLPVVYYGLIPFSIMPALGIWALVTHDIILEANLRPLVGVWVALGLLLFACGLYTRRLVRLVETQTQFNELTADRIGMEQEVAG